MTALASGEKRREAVAPMLSPYTQTLKEKSGCAIWYYSTVHTEMGIKCLDWHSSQCPLGMNKGSRITSKKTQMELSWHVKEAPGLQISSICMAMKSV